MRIAGNHQEFRREHDQRESPSHISESFHEGVQDRSALGTGQQVEYDFAVACRMENRAVALKLPAYVGRVGEVAVVRQRNGTPPAVYQDRLCICKLAFTRRRITDMPNGRVTGQLLEMRFAENVRHMPHFLAEMEFPSVRAHDAGRFLAPVLQSVQSQVGQPRRLRMRHDRENATLLFQLIPRQHQIFTHVGKQKNNYI